MMKKINLKKQLAFISSLALIAGTALYMPANAGEILGISKTLSASADESSVTENEITDLGYCISYHNNKGQLKEYSYNTESDGFGDAEEVLKIGETEPYHIDIKAIDDTMVDVILYVPDDISISDTNVNFHLSFKYGETSYSKDDVVILNNGVMNSDNDITARVTTKLVPSWDSMENVKNNEDIVFTDADKVEHKSDRYTVTYEKDTDNNSWVRVYTLKDEIPTYEISSVNYADLATDKNIYTNRYFNTLNYSFDTNAASNLAIYSGISGDEQLSSENFKYATAKYPSIYIKDGKFSTDENGILIIEDFETNHLFTNYFDLKYYAGNDGYVYELKDNYDGSFDIKRFAKITNSYVKVQSVPVVNVTFNPNGGVFSGNTTANKIVEVNKDELYSIPADYTPTRKGYTFKEWNSTSGHYTYNSVDKLWQFNDDNTLIASWTPINYQVVIAGFEESSTVEKFSCDYDTPTYISTNAITKTGYRLVGFSRKPDATVPDNDLKCSNNTVIFNNLTDKAESVTIYPIWEKVKSPSIKLGGNECFIENVVLKDSSAANSESNPYLIVIVTSYSDPTNDIEDVAYGTTFDYEFIPVDGTVTISGSKGKITYGDIDYINIVTKSTNTEVTYLYAAVLAETGIYKVSVDGKETYYQAVFSNSIQATSVGNDSTYSIGASVTGTNSDGTVYCPENLDMKDYNNVFQMDGKLELVDGNYVKNYTMEIPSSIKAKSKINVTLKEFKDGYSADTENNSFDVTLDENGNASKIVKVSSTWEGKENVEYIKFNFVLTSKLDADDAYSGFNFQRNSTSIGSDSYTSKYVAEDNKYVKVYTIRDSLNDDDVVKAYYGNYKYFNFTDGDTTSKELSFTGNTSNTVIISDDNINEYIKVVFNPEYTLKFCDDDKKTVLAEMPETVSGKYTLPENPTKAGFKFAGWYVGNDIQLYDGMEVARAHGTEAYAKWTPITYTVKIDANGGKAVTKAPTGWSIADYEKSVQKTDVQYSTNDRISRLVVVGSEEDFSTYNAGLLVSRDGYDLLGFSTDKNATVPDENLSFLDEDGNLTDERIMLKGLTTEDGATVTLYAIWRAESGEITLDATMVRYNETTPMKSSYVVLENNKIKYTIGSKVGELPVPELKGHTFEGWYYKINPTDEYTKLTADMTFTKELVEAMKKVGGVVSNFTANKYAINYDDCGTDNNTSAVKFEFNTFVKGLRVLNSDGKYIDYETLIAEPEKAGYKFVGYTINGIVKNDFAETKEYFTADDIKKIFDGNELMYNTSATKTENFVIGAEDITIKGIWKIDETKSIINVDYDNAVISYKNAKGTTITVKPTSSSYEKFPSSIIGTPEERISAKCEIDGDDGMDNITFTDYGFDVDDTECTLSKDGYVFKGWFTKDSNGKEIAFNSTTFTAGVTNVYAKWEAESKLTAPENVAVSADGTVSWNGGENAAYFRVYKVYNGITKNAKTTSSPYTFQSLASGVEHEIYVVAYDGNGNSLKSESVKFTPVSAPENVAVSADGTVTWTGGEGASYYRVYKVYNGITKNAKTTSSPYTFQSLAKGVEHEIYVVAFDKDGNQYKSESVKFTPVSAPANVKVSEDGTVSWTGGEGASYYRVYKVYNGITKNAKTTSSPYTFQNLAEGVEHEIYVTAFDKDGNQYRSESVKFTPEKKAVLTAPTNIKVDADGNVTWTAAENAAYYKVSKVVGGKTYTGKQITDTKYTFISFNPGQNKTVYVTAFDKDGNSIKSASVTVKAVENLKVTTTGTVTFDKVDGASYYKVFKEYNGITKNAKTTTSPYKFQTFTKGVKHDVYVKAFNAAGKEIAVSKTVTVTAK